MGGLVASGYLSLGSSQRNKVETVITLGSPLLGTSVITYLWGSEDFDVTGLLDEVGLENWQKNLLEFVTLYYDVFDMFLGNFKSLYELFPSEKYFDNTYAGKSYLVTSILGASELEITTYSETQERLESYLAFYKSSHITSAENFHASLYSGSSHVTELVNTYYIAGYNVSTIDKIECNMWDWSVYSNTTQGDSLVAVWSATLGDRAANRTFFAKDITHMGLVSNGEVKMFIKGLIEGNTSVSAYPNIHTNMQ